MYSMYSLQNGLDQTQIFPANLWDRPGPIVLVKCWKVVHRNAKKLLEIAKNP